MRISARLAGTLCTLFFLIAPAIQAQRVPLPDGAFYYKPASTVHGAASAWINPSALGRYEPIEVQLMTDYRDDSFGKNWGFVLSRRGFAGAYRTLETPSGDFKEWVLSGGYALGHMISLGGSYRHFADGPEGYNNRHFWNLSISSHGQGPFSIAAVVSNLNRGRIDGDRSEIEQRYSLAYRPMQKTVTIAVDAMLSTGTKLSNTDLVYHVEVQPTGGLYIEGMLDSDENFQIGLRANLLQYFTGSQSGYNSDADHLGTTFYVGATSKRQPSLIPDPERRLALSVNGEVAENPSQPVFGSKRTSFADIVLNIYRAAEDPSIGEMVIKFNRLALGLAQAQEVRDALKYFQSQNKRIICHLSSPNNIGYYVASVADSILIPPVSRFNLVGLRMEMTFYAGTMEKLGINGEVLRIGDYKRGAEQFTRKESSEESREMTNRILDNIYRQFVDGIADGRGISPDSVRTLIDQGPFTSEDALELGLVDGLSYADRIRESGFLSGMPQISFRSYLSDTLINDGWPRLPQLAIVYAEGEITDGSVPDPFDDQRDVRPGTMHRAFARARANYEVEGVVFRVNSPGGLALVGEEIYHDAERTANTKPMAVSMSNVAASGGYYIAMASERVFASPGTLTGSIGIYGGKADLSGLYEKIGLGKELYTRGRFAGMLTSIRPFTEDERRKYFSMLSAFYQHFISLVAENRSVSADSIDALGQGRVWLGNEAVRNGLVDEPGGLKQTLDYMARKLDINDYRVVTYPEKRYLFKLPNVPLLGGIARVLGFGDKELESAAALPPTPDDGDLFTRMPYDIDFR